METINLTRDQFNYLCENACVDCGIALENENICNTLKRTDITVEVKQNLIIEILNNEF